MLRCYITDRRGCPDLLACIERAAAAGVHYIQIREKDLSGRELLDLTRAAVEVARPWPARVLVNGRVDVALVAGAHGVHLPAKSIAVEEWRTLVPPGFRVGVSCHTLDELQCAAQADFAVYGPVFPSPGKGTPIGLEGLRVAARSAQLPILALGGVDEQNAQSCIKAGAAGIAAIRMFQNP